MFYHASKMPNLKTLKPHTSNHGKPLVYLSSKRENVLVYLCNAVEKHCRRTGFQHDGVYYTWASYGFTKSGILRLEEYYPNATADTYMGESGFIYSVEHIENCSALADIPCAFIAENEITVSGCECVPDAYEAIMKAVNDGEIILQRYEDNSTAMMNWIEKIINEDYQNAEQRPDYREFLKAKFSFLSI